MFLTQPQHPIIVNTPVRSISHSGFQHQLFHLDVENRTGDVALYEVLRHRDEFVLMSYQQAEKYQTVGNPILRRVEQVLHSLGNNQVVMLARKKPHTLKDPYFEFNGERYYLNNPPNIFQMKNDLLVRSDDSFFGEKTLELQHDEKSGPCFLVRASRKVRFRLNIEYANEIFRHVSGENHFSYIGDGAHILERILAPRGTDKYWLIFEGTEVGLEESCIRNGFWSGELDPLMTVKDITEPSGALKNGAGTVVIQHADGSLESVSENFAIELRARDLVKEFSYEDQRSGFADDMARYYAQTDIRLIMETGEFLPVL